MSLLGLTFGNLIKSAIAYLGLSLFTYCYLNIESFVRTLNSHRKIIYYYVQPDLWFIAWAGVCWIFKTAVLIMKISYYHF